LAISHCKVKNGGAGNGAKHAQYVGGEGRQADRDDVLYAEDGNLPNWAGNAVKFFAAADEHERSSYTKSAKTKDGIQYEKTVSGRAYKELEVAIPREAKDPVQWAKDFARELVGDKHPYRMGVHDKKAQDGGRNPHLHMMFSTRTMDGFDRTKEQFFKRANVGTYKVKGEIREHKPGSGGAKKSDFWNSREAVPHTRSLFERHVQRVAPEFKLQRSEAPEPKIGPVLKNSPSRYEEGREQRVVDVYELRTMKKERAALGKEIEREELMVGGQARRPSATDGLWAKMAPKSEPQRESAGKPDWSKFQSVAGTRAVADQEKGKTMEPQNGPQYFPQSKQEKERNRDDVGALQRIEQQRKDQKEQEQPKSRSDDLWERMQRDRQEKAQQDREKDSSRDMDM
jgi:hypothetical protein